MPTHRPDAELPTPAWVFELLTGLDPGCRLRGWVRQLHGGQHGEPTAADVWEQYQDALCALAAAHGFEPFHVTRKRPRGPGFERWRRDFLAEHTY